MSTDVNMIIGAQDQATPVHKTLEGSFKGLSAAAETALAPMLASMASFQGIIGAVAGGAGIKSLVSAFTSWNGEVVTLSRNLGMTTEQASVFNTALRLTGIDSDLAVSAGMRLARTIDTNEERFAKLGVTVRDSGGNLRSTPAIMGEVNAALAAMSTGTERNVAANEIYGRSWGEVQQLMKLTPEVMDKAGESAKNFGLIVDKEAAESAKKYKLAMNELGLATDSLKISLGKELMPVMSGVAGGMTTVAEHMGTVKIAILEATAVGVIANLGRLKTAIEAIKLASLGAAGGVGLIASAAGAALMFGMELADKQNTKSWDENTKRQIAEYEAARARHEGVNAATRPDLSRSVGMTDTERQKMLADMQSLNLAMTKMDEQKNANLLSKGKAMAGAYLANEKSKYDMGAASADEYYTYKLQLLTWETQQEQKSYDMQITDLRSKMAGESDHIKQLGIETEIYKVQGEKEKNLIESSKKRIDIVRELTDAEKKEREESDKKIEQHDKEIKQMDEYVNQLWPKYAEQMARELGMDDASIKLSKQLADGLKTQIDLELKLTEARKIGDDDAVAKLQKIIELQSAANIATAADLALQERKAVLTGQIVGFSNGVPIYKDAYANAQAKAAYQTDASLTGKTSSSLASSFGSASSVASGFSTNQFTSDPYWTTPATVAPPVLAVGTPRVLSDGLAFLHKGESVNTVAQTNSANFGGVNISINAGATYDPRTLAKSIYSELQQLGARYRQ